jgi:hypothetical protein
LHNNCTFNSEQHRQPPRNHRISLPDSSQKQQELWTCSCTKKIWTRPRSQSRRGLSSN